MGKQPIKPEITELLDSNKHFSQLCAQKNS